MPYDSAFWFQRAQETHALSEQMSHEGARSGMHRLARKYERIALQGAYDEARDAFDSAREALRVSHGTASSDQISLLTRAVDNAWTKMQKARDAMEIFRSINLLIVEDVDVPDFDGSVSSAR